jgi:hypothetical protein
MWGYMHALVDLDSCEANSVPEIKICVCVRALFCRVILSVIHAFLYTYVYPSAVSPFFCWISHVCAFIRLLYMPFPSPKEAIQAKSPCCIHAYTFWLSYDRRFSGRSILAVECMHTYLFLSIFNAQEYRSCLFLMFFAA